MSNRALSVAWHRPPQMVKHIISPKIVNGIREHFVLGNARNNQQNHLALVHLATKNFEFVNPGDVLQFNNGLYLIVQQNNSYQLLRMNVVVSPSVSFGSKFNNNHSHGNNNNQGGNAFGF